MKFSFLFISLASFCLASPAGNQVTPGSIDQVKCNPKVKLSLKDINRAILSICGGIGKPIEQCQGNPTSTTGKSGGAQFDLTTTEKGATINISKGRWERGVRTALAQCDGAGFSGVIPKGASKGNVAVVLSGLKNS